jgi:hypothetical protein
MARAGREFAVAHGPQLMSKSLLADRDLELVSQPLGQVYDPPAHDAVGGGNRPRLDDLLQCVAVLVIENRLRPWCLACRQTVRSIRIEAQNPVPNNLPRHPANKGCIAATTAIQDRCNRQ